MKSFWLKLQRYYFIGGDLYYWIMWCMCIVYLSYNLDHNLNSWFGLLWFAIQIKSKCTCLIHSQSWKHHCVLFVMKIVYWSSFQFRCYMIINKTLLVFKFKIYSQWHLHNVKNLKLCIIIKNKNIIHNINVRSTTRSYAYAFILIHFTS